MNWQLDQTQRREALEKGKEVLVSPFLKLKKLVLNNVGIYVVPEEFQGLSLLESLQIIGCSQLKEIPQWIDSLASLKELVIKECSELTSLPKQIANLSNLESLEIKGCLNLVEICRKPTSEVGLMNSQLDPTQQREALDKGKEVVVSPFLKLKKLELNNVGIDVVPEEFEGLTSLESLKIVGCVKLKEISKWIDSLISLKEVILSELPGLMWLSEQMASLSNLESLEVSLCPSLKQIWQQPTDQDRHAIPSFPRLKCIYFRDVELETVPQELRSLPSLESLIIKGCEKLKEIPEWIGSLTSLKYLIISRCPQLTSLLKQKATLPNLETLILRGCSNLEEIWQKPTGEDWALNPLFPTLKDLEFMNMGQRVFPKEFRGISSLESLAIWGCKQLKEIPEWIDTLTSLKTIRIVGCPELMSLPKQVANLSNVDYLYIRCCPSLKERCQKPKGQDWPLIQHVRHVDLEE